MLDESFGPAARMVTSREKSMSLPTYIPPTTKLDMLADALGDSTRRAIFKHVVDSGEPITASDVGSAFNVHRTVARAHLERLVDAGLLVTETRHRAEGGRPPKVYSRGDRRLEFQLPMRQYELLAELLLNSLADFGTAAEIMVHRAGYDFGRRLGTELPEGPPEERLLPLMEAGAELTVQGPEDGDESGEITVQVHNCLFREVAARQPELVCTLDRAVMEGLLSSGGDYFALDEAIGRTDEEDLCTLRFRRTGEPPNTRSFPDHAAVPEIEADTNFDRQADARLKESR